MTEAPVKHIENRYGKSKSLQINKNNFELMSGVLFIVECYIVLKTKGWKGLTGLLKDRGKIL